jgi:hypothetical protein
MTLLLNDDFNTVFNKAIAVVNWGNDAEHKDLGLKIK